MTADDHVCMPLVDDAGQVIARVRVSPDLSEEGRRALVRVAEAAIRFQAERDAADPEAAVERERRQERMRERARRWRGESG